MLWSWWVVAKMVDKGFLFFEIGERVNSSNNWHHHKRQRIPKNDKNYGSFNTSKFCWFLSITSSKSGQVKTPHCEMVLEKNRK